MRKRILNLLRCPNTQANSLKVFAHKLKRGNLIFNDVIETKMQDADDIINGVVVNYQKNYAFPIDSSIAILLSDSDTDTKMHIENLQSIRKYCPASFIKPIDFTINRLKLQKPALNGIWNRDEMAYFDKRVFSDQLRKESLETIKKVPLWNLFISRKYLTTKIELKGDARYVLEVGCGNARTIHWIFHPKQHQYNYVGSDISFKRLLLAKSLIPEGDFIQCSAFNLPFKDKVFMAVIGFGVFHHLPNPLNGINNCASKIKSNGYFALHEPIIRPKLIPGDSPLKKLFIDYNKDEHDNAIDEEKTLKILKRLGFEIILRRNENSIFRTLALSLLSKTLEFPFSRKRMIKIINFTDDVLLKTVCHISRRIGPSGLLILAQRTFY